MYKVLIADDEPWSRTVVSSLGAWEPLGLQLVGEAEDGLEAVRLVGELNPHILITDMRMPGLEGVELLQELARRYPELRIVIMSGYQDFVYLKQAIRSQAVEYLLKPVNPEELNDALSRCAESLKERELSTFGGIRLPEAAAELVTDTVRQFTEHLDAVDAERKIRGHLDIHEVQAFIELHFMDPITLESVAQRFFVVKEHLSRTFKSQTGENITDYIVRKKMEKSRQLITELHVPIKTAAQMVGYEDVAYFYRVFKRHFGMTPGELQKDASK